MKSWTWAAGVCSIRHVVYKKKNKFHINQENSRVEFLKLRLEHTILAHPVLIISPRKFFTGKPVQL